MWFLVTVPRLRKWANGVSGTLSYFYWFADSGGGGLEMSRGGVFKGRQPAFLPPLFGFNVRESFVPRQNLTEQRQLSFSFPPLLAFATPANPLLPLSSLCRHVRFSMDAVEESAPLPHPLSTPILVQSTKEKSLEFLLFFFILFVASKDFTLREYYSAFISFNFRRFIYNASSPDMAYRFPCAN